jgi:MoxR-like ATPase
MLLTRQKGDPLKQIIPVVDTQILVQLQQQVAETHVAPEIAEYVVRLMDATRRSNTLLRGGSPRATLAVTALAKAVAQLRGRDYVVPKDVQEVFAQVLSHRVQPAPGQDAPVDQLLQNLMGKVRSPKLR